MSAAHESIKAYAEAEFLRRQAARRQHPPYPRWTTLWTGRIYRPVMRLAHRFGFCFPSDVAVEPGYVWCHWCGMRGRL